MCLKNISFLIKCFIDANILTQNETSVIKTILFENWILKTYIIKIINTDIGLILSAGHFNWPLFLK